MEGWKPNIVIGIDFGMTQTAVSYSSAPEWPEPKCIQQWPGLPHHASLANKVPSQAGYDADQNLLDWGFHCVYTTQELSVEKEFKLYLDPDFPDTYPSAPTHAEAKKFYVDYMSSLCKFIQVHFRQWYPNWHEQNVEYLFSIPTTWTSARLTARLEEWLEEAGFGGSNKRRIKIAQTEAEAAAVYTAKAQPFQKGDIIMVADAGGATTDINILELMEHSRNKTQLKALNKAEGINVGSTLIDQQIKHFIAQKLRGMNVTGDDKELIWHAEDIMQDSDFEGIKCSFDGTNLSMSSSFAVPAEILSLSTRGRGSRIMIPATHLKSIFDTQIDLICEKINQQKTELLRERPNSHIQYLVLSGGLGSSKYLQNRVRNRYTNMQVLCSPEPQLVVAKGLVMERVQKLNKGAGIYTGKCSRTSYGVLIRLPYDEVKHRGERVTKDPLDRMLWAEDQIDWLIKEGQAVPEDGLLIPYRLKVAKGEEDNSFNAQFVSSKTTARHLPGSLRTGYDVSRVCTVTANFRVEDFDTQGAGFKYKRAGFLSRSKDHYIAEFHLRVVVGSADLKFELIAKDGLKFNQNTATIQVEWEEAEPGPSTTTNVRRSMFPG